MTDKYQWSVTLSNMNGYREVDIHIDNSPDGMTGHINDLLIQYGVKQ